MTLTERKNKEERLSQRWGWYTNDIADDDLKINTQMVLENSYRTMVADGSVPKGWLENMLNEAAAEAEGVITEAPQSSGAVGDFVIPKVMFPIIKRVMPELIANKLVSVQPISQPSGVIYFITYTYSNSKGAVKAGDEFSGNPYQTKPAYSVYYSSEKFPVELGADDEADNVASIKEFLMEDALRPAAYKRIEIADKTTHRTILAKKVTVAGDVLTFSSDDGLTPLATVDFSTNKITLTDATKEILAAGADDKIVCYVVYNQEGTSHIPEMEFSMDHMDVSLTEKKLKVRWTKEAEQDMNAYHKIDVEQELVKVAAIQTNYETDRQIMEAVEDIIISQLCGQFDWTDDEGNGTQGNYLDRHRALAQRMYQYTTKVAMYNRIAPADWAVCSPQVAAALQMLPDWKTGEISKNKSTFYNAGALGNGTVSVYCDPNRMNNDITLGYKPKDTTYGAGLVYSPYANWMSGTVVNPDNFNNVRGTFSRFGITSTPRAEFNYARITLDNFAI